MKTGEFVLFQKYYKKICSLHSHEVRYLHSARLISKQRLLSLNNRVVSQNKVTEGFTDPLFKKCLSRGYATIRPKKRQDASSIHKYGPFYKLSPTVKFAGWSPMNY